MLNFPLGEVIQFDRLGKKMVGVVVSRSTIFAMRDSSACGRMKLVKHPKEATSANVDSLEYNLGLIMKAVRKITLKVGH